MDNRRQEFKVLSLGCVVLLVSGCSSGQLPAPVEYDLPSIELTVTITVTPTSQVTRFCKVEALFPSTATSTIDTAALSAPQIDFGKFDLELPQSPSFSAPSWSPDRTQAVVSIRGMVNGRYRTGVALLDIESKESRWLLSYLSLEDWMFADPLWSPDGKWVTLIPRDAAYADDIYLWIFSANSEENHRFRAQYLEFWSPDSRLLFFGIKDYCGFVDVTTWNTHDCAELCSAD